MFKQPDTNKFDRFLINRSKQSWWIATYNNGKQIAEWETAQNTKVFLPGQTQGKTSRWEEIPKVGMRGLFLFCPTWPVTVGTLESNGDYLFFQLKVSIAAVGIGSSCIAHIIGKVDADDGRCVCYRWEYATKKLVRFEDNVTHMAYENIGPISLGEHTGIK